ncbi:hypothetical protein EVAR_76658_1 [Eumeta japonica]|uniref:Retrovirus-related Pol polyprotein from transposon opus n=1 Tax=Eumeta variegata TaxID=151549 RepID=A0A4C1SBK1_EUMVA|nr:hypothetical protein EVAR_76658_1 [Eumeta japonica]
MQEFEIGDSVYVENGNRLNRKKLDELKIGPFKIIEKISNSIYKIDTGNTKTESTLFHITKLHPVTAEDEVEENEYEDNLYKEGLLIDYAIKKERLLLDVNKSMDSKTMIDLIATGLPGFILQKLNRDELNDTTDLFNEIRKYEGSVRDYEAHIDLQVNRYCSKRPYRCTIEDRLEIEEQIAMLLRNNLIEESYSPFAAPVTLAFKKDHKPLENMNIKSRTDEELGDLTYYLSQYDFTVKYIPGKENVEADCLSRNPVLESEDNKEELLEIVNLIQIKDIVEDQEKMKQ